MLRPSILFTLASLAAFFAVACGAGNAPAANAATGGDEGAAKVITEVPAIEERKALMADLSDAFIAMPGAYGTLDELFEVLTWNQLGIVVKPIGLLNVKGFFDPLIRMADHAVEEKFLRPEHRSILQIDDKEDALLDKLEAWQPVTAEKWIERLKAGGI